MCTDVCVRAGHSCWSEVVSRGTNTDIRMEADSPPSTEKADFSSPRAEPKSNGSTFGLAASASGADSGATVLPKAIVTRSKSHAFLRSRSQPRKLDLAPLIHLPKEVPSQRQSKRSKEASTQPYSDSAPLEGRVRDERPAELRMPSLIPKDGNRNSSMMAPQPDVLLPRGPSRPQARAYSRDLMSNPYATRQSWMPSDKSLSLDADRVLYRTIKKNLSTHIQWEMRSRMAERHRYDPRYDLWWRTPGSHTIVGPSDIDEELDLDAEIDQDIAAESAHLSLHERPVERRERARAAPPSLARIKGRNTPAFSLSSGVGGHWRSKAACTARQSPKALHAQSPRAPYLGILPVDPISAAAAASEPTSAGVCTVKWTSSQAVLYPPDDYAALKPCSPARTPTDAPPTQASPTASSRRRGLGRLAAHHRPNSQPSIEREGHGEGRNQGNAGTLLPRVAQLPMHGSYSAPQLA